MTTSYKDFLGSKDVKWWDGLVRTFTRRTSTGGSITLNKIGAMCDVVEAYGSGTDYSSTSLGNALSAITTANVTLLFQPGTWNITDNVTVPANIALCIPQGAKFVIAAGKTLTINGMILAGSYIVFDGTGTIAGAPIMMWKDPTWFSGTVVDSTAPTWKTPKTSVMQTDTISETTAAAGVTIDGVKLKDSEPYCDVINEKTAAAGVTIDGVKLKDSQPYCDVINEKTADAGVTVDGLLVKDGQALSAKSLSIQGEINAGTATATTTIDVGTVTAGDRILVTALAYYTAGNATGRDFWYVGKSSGTATIAVYNAQSNISQSIYHTTSEAGVILNMSGVIRVTGSGTLVLKCYAGVMAGTGQVYVANELHAFFVKKQ